MCRPVSDYPAIVEAEHSGHCLSQGCPSSQTSSIPFILNVAKKNPHILRNNPAMYPSVEVTKNKIIIIIYWNIVLAYLRTVSDGSYFPRWREVGEEDYRVTAEQTWSPFNLSPTLYERSQSIAFQRWHGADLCYRSWTWNTTEHNPFSNTAVTLSPGGKLVRSRAETVAAGPCGLAFPLTDAR